MFFLSIIDLPCILLWKRTRIPRINLILSKFNGCRTSLLRYHCHRTRTQFIGRRQCQVYISARIYNLSHSFCRRLSYFIVQHSVFLCYSFWQWWLFCFFFICQKEKCNISKNVSDIRVEKKI